MQPTKLTLVKRVLADERSQPVRDWLTEVEVDPDSLTTANVREYGLDGKGEVADEILKGGVEAGIITQDDIETMEF